MSLASRVSFCLLALSLGLVIPGMAQSQSPSSTQRSTRSADEETLRRLTEQYGSAIAAGDLEAIREFWDPQSPNLVSHVRLYQSFFSTSRYEFVNLNVTTLDVGGDRAVSHLTTDERLVDKVTGTLLTERDLFHGAVRSLEWIKTGGGWKIERESLLQEELAVRLEAAVSEDEQRELLDKEKALVTDVLVRALIDRSTSHRLNRKYDTASSSLRLAQSVAEKIGDQAGLAKAWLYMAMVRDTQGDEWGALPLQQRALELHEAAGNRLGEAITLYAISHNYHEVGDYRKAFECARKSLRLAEEMKHRGVMAHALSEMAHVYIYQNNDQQALVCLERALSIFQEMGDKIQIAIARFTIVTRHQELGNYDRALEIYLKLLEQTEGRGDQIGGAVIRNAIGTILYYEGRNAEALDSYRKSLQASDAANFPRSAIPTLIHMSELHLSESKYKDALPLAERAVSMARQILDQRSLHNALALVGYCYLGLNQPEDARRAFSEAISTIEDLRAQTTGGVEERLRHFEIMLDGYHGMLSLLVKENQPLEALVFAERARARGLLDMLLQGRVSVQKAMTSSEREQEFRLKAEMTRLNTQLTRARQLDKPDAERISELKSQLEKTRFEYEDFQTALYTAHPDLRVQRGEAPVINAKELTALLPGPTSAVLEYVVTDDKIFLFAITRVAGKADADVHVYALPIKRAELARQIEAFRQQLAGRDLGFRASAVKLYQLLLKPAESQLRDKTNLVIAPDDKLWDLPFQALLTSANRFLIENTAIAYTPSLTVLREMTRRRMNRGADAASGTLLALGNPLLGKETIERAALTLRDESLDPLPEAEQEVKALRRLYGISQSKVYIGTEAREDRVKSEAGQARILHFAAHGMLNNNWPMYSHLALAQGDANEDGLLEAWELMQLDLKADLAVLSACETARGRIGAGEGMIGLSWAMFIAGVPSIVVSQWKVESAGTRDLMVSFHRALISQPGGAKPAKSEALRQAALKLMKTPETRHPFYWAGFVLVGDGR